MTNAGAINMMMRSNQSPIVNQSLNLIFENTVVESYDISPYSYQFQFQEQQQQENHKQQSLNNNNNNNHNNKGEQSSSSFSKKTT